MSSPTEVLKCVHFKTHLTNVVISFQMALPFVFAEYVPVISQQRNLSDPLCFLPVWNVHERLSGIVSSYN